MLFIFFLSIVSLGVFINNQAIIAQMKNIYGDNVAQVAGLNSLMSAVAANDIAGVRFFSKGGLSLINQKNIGGATALSIACRNNNFAIAQLLIENGADVNIADNEGWTPLMRAALSGSNDIINLLLSKNANAALSNSVNESAIIHAASSDCDKCLALMFEKFNFIKLMDESFLKAQINEAFLIAKNHENQAVQNVLEKYLDSIIKMSALAKPQNVDEDLGNISITQDNKLNLVTKNSGNFVEKDLVDANKNQQTNVKNKFKFAGAKIIDSNSSSDSSQTYIVEKKPTISKFKIQKGNKFVLISDLPNENSQTKNKPTLNKKFKSNDSNAVFLMNSKINDKNVVEVLKSKKFRFSQGPNPITDKVIDDKEVKTIKQSTEANKNISKDSQDKIAPIPPIVSSFKFLSGPKSGSKSEPKGVQQRNKNSAPKIDEKIEQDLKNSSQDSSKQNIQQDNSQQAPKKNFRLSTGF
ncbi:MAG: ankyrin repeat domain-containing protein [Rickettsiales bacterium]|nr:ankyrin repeat domain-containing protein [Rickettsiales bacterium]